MDAYRALRRLVMSPIEWIVGLIATIEMMILIVSVLSLFMVSDT